MDRIVTQRRVFIVEDEAMVRLLVEEMVGELGYQVAGGASNLVDALAALPQAEFDVAILDVNLGGTSSSPVAALLRDLGRPFVVATGYSKSGLEPTFAEAPTISKPFMIEHLGSALHLALTPSHATDGGSKAPR